MSSIGLRLTELLDSATRVAIVVAPPRYGKTVLAEQWCATSNLPSAWLSLDLLDEDPVRFWSNFMGAVRTALPVVDDEPELSLLENPVDRRFRPTVATHWNSRSGRARDGCLIAEGRPTGCRLTAIWAWHVSSVAKWNLDRRSRTLSGMQRPGPNATSLGEGSTART